MTENPYAAPRAELLTEPEAIGALYSYLQVGTAALLGGPFVAMWMLRSNFLELRRDTLAHATLWSGLILGCLWLLLVIMLPKAIPALLFPLAQGGIAGYLAYEFHEKDPRRPAAEHLRLKNNGLVLALALAGAAAAILVMFGLLMLLLGTGYWTMS